MSSNREVVAEYSDCMQALAQKLLCLISESMGLPSSCIEEAVGEFYQNITVSYYPPCPQPELTLGLQSHSDMGAITLLIQDDVGGLQVLKDGEWVTVHPVSDAIVVILADQTEVITNGQYRSSQHRAITNSSKGRLSVATFHDPAKTMKVSPVIHPPRYKQVIYGDYVSSWYTKGPEGKRNKETSQVFCVLQKGCYLKLSLMARGDDGSGKGSGGFKLFGVEINLEDHLYTSSSSESIVRSHEVEDECMRKSKSMGNLHEICNREEHHGVAGDDSEYHSDGALHLNSRRAALIRKKGIPWTPSEHRSFLIGLKKLGKGVWKGISKNYVPTRTPTQVASHAQKYFIRLTAAEKKKRRASLFDIPFNESNLPPHSSTAASLNASEGSQLVGLSAHIAASERKPPLSPTTRTYVPDTWPVPYMAGVPGQSFPAAHDMPQTELYRMFNYSYPSYYSVPSSHVNFSAPFMRQKPNDLFLQHHPILHGASQGRPETSVAGNIAMCAPFPNQYQTPNGPATSTVAKKDGPISALSL